MKGHKKLSVGDKICSTFHVDRGDFIPLEIYQVEEHGTKGKYSYYCKRRGHSNEAVESTHAVSAQDGFNMVISDMWKQEESDYEHIEELIKLIREYRDNIKTYRSSMRHTESKVKKLLEKSGYDFTGEIDV